MALESEPAVIQIVIVDAHDLYRMGLARYLERQPDLHVVAHAPSGAAGLRLIRQLKPGVVVMDQDLPEITVADVVTDIAAVSRSPRVVVLGASIDPAAVTEALAAGARSYLGKNSRMDDLAAAIRAAATGNCWLAEEVSEIVFARLRESSTPDLPSHAIERLSAREIEVLKLLARGMDNSEIATALAIRPSTAKNHVSSILSKLEVPNRILAAVYAMRHDLV